MLMLAYITLSSTVKFPDISMFPDKCLRLAVSLVEKVGWQEFSDRQLQIQTGRYVSFVPKWGISGPKFFFQQNSQILFF